MELPYKKRNRVPASCSVCRKRKSRCDRVKPICGSCKKKSISHLCYYETDSKEPSSHVTYVPPLPDHIPQVSFVADPSLPSPSLMSPPPLSQPPPIQNIPPLQASTPNFRPFDMSPSSKQPLPPPQSFMAPPTLDEGTFVNIPLGPTTTLSVNTNEEITTFDNASFSLSCDGAWSAQQGMLSYIGLTKSDPYLKVIRNYTLELCKTGEIAKLMPQPQKRRHQSSASQSPIGLKRPRFDATSPGAGSDRSSVATAASERPERPESDPLQEDALIVQRIVKNEDDAVNDEESPRPKTKSTLNDQKPSPFVQLDAIGLIQSRYDVYSLVSSVVLKILPDKLNLFMLFCRYFKYVHHFVPVVEEKRLLGEAELLFGSFPNFSRERYQEIAIESDHDLINLGVFLVVIRLGYMSLLHNQRLEYDEDEKSMILHMRKTSDQDYLRLVLACVSDQLVGSKSSIAMVQALALAHFYRSVISSDCLGLGAADGHTLFASAVRHAMNAGLNRDPSKYTGHESIRNQQPFFNRWRAIWHYLVTTDAFSAMHCGTIPRIPSLETSDVECPTFTDVCGEVNSLAALSREISNHYRKIAIMVSNVSVKPKVSVVLAETNALEKLFFQMFGKDFFRDCICKPASNPVPPVGSPEHELEFLKVFKYSVFIHLRTNLSCMYYMIALHYENLGGEAGMRTGLGLFKIWVKSVVQLVYIMSFVLENSVKVFGRNYDFFLTPVNERCMVKNHAFLTSFFTRLLHHRMDLSLKVGQDAKFAPRLEVVNRFFSVVVMESELFIGSFRRLSKHYVQSWKVYVMSQLVIKQCMENPTLFFKGLNSPRFFHSGTNAFDYLTNAEMESLCSLCTEFRVAKDETVRSHGVEPSAGNGFTKRPSDLSPTVMSQPSEDASTTSFSPSMGHPQDPYADMSQVLDGFSMDGERLAGGPVMEDNPNVDLLKLFEMYSGMEGTGV